MIEYGPAFYGSDDLHKILNGEIGAYYSPSWSSWQFNVTATFKKGITNLYKLPIDHWFYGSDEFKRAKKYHDVPANLLADYSDDELQAEIDRRKAQDSEITILARKLCADICNRSPFTKKEYIEGCCDKTEDMRLAKAAIIAGMELQKGCEA